MTPGEAAFYERWNIGVPEPLREQFKAQLTALLDAREREVREKCMQDIRAACEPCGGTGIAEIKVHDIIDDDGKGNPVLVGQQSEHIECEYCGSPIAAIRAQGRG